MAEIKPVDPLYAGKVLTTKTVLVMTFLMLLGFVGIVELSSFLTIGLAQGKRLSLFGHVIDIFGALPWLIALGCLLGGGIWLAKESRVFKRVWDELMESARADGSG